MFLCVQMDEGGGGFPPGSKIPRSSDSNKKINEYFKQHQQIQQQCQQQTVAPSLTSSPSRHSERHSNSGAKSPLPNKIINIVSILDIFSQNLFQ